MQRVRELAHLPALGLDERHHVLAVGQERAVGWTAQRDVQSGPILGVVDRVACKHELDPAPHLGLLGELEQQLEARARRAAGG